MFIDTKDKSACVADIGNKIKFALENLKKPITLEMMVHCVECIHIEAEEAEKLIKKYLKRGIKYNLLTPNQVQIVENFDLGEDEISTSEPHAQIVNPPEVKPCEECCQVYSGPSIRHNEIPEIVNPPEVPPCEECCQVYSRPSIRHNEIAEIEDPPELKPCEECCQVYSGPSIRHNEIAEIEDPPELKPCKECCQVYSRPTIRRKRFPFSIDD